MAEMEPLRQRAGSSVALEFREVALLPAVAWTILPWLTLPLVLGAGLTVLWLRSDALGRGERLAGMTAVFVLVALPMLLGYIFLSVRGYRGTKLCRVVPPVSMLQGAASQRRRVARQLIATAPLQVIEGHLILTDWGVDYPLVDCIARVRIGVYRKRWCCYAVFTARAGKVSKRVHAFGRLPLEVRQVEPGSIG